MLHLSKCPSFESQFGCFLLFQTKSPQHGVMMGMPHEFGRSNEVHLWSFVCVFAYFVYRSSMYVYIHVNHMHTQAFDYNLKAIIMYPWTTSNQGEERAL